MMVRLLKPALVALVQGGQARGLWLGGTRGDNTKGVLGVDDCDAAAIVHPTKLNHDRVHL